mmetsp:Transcript_3519/g.9720  ORF Transcript_3519/g.9720 Transcript_3519/m.9720 type:complete len:126 (+) Transcript_3519:1686-2063(+)
MPRQSMFILLRRLERHGQASASLPAIWHVFGQGQNEEVPRKGYTNEVDKSSNEHHPNSDELRPYQSAPEEPLCSSPQNNGNLSLHRVRSTPRSDRLFQVCQTDKIRANSNIWKAANIAERTGLDG